MFRRGVEDVASFIRPVGIIMNQNNHIAELLGALKFAANKHRNQRRKGIDASPYINHPIDVVEVIACTGGIDDLATLQAAVLHDTIEDTQTTAEELEEVFGAEVRSLVEEVTDDKRLPKAERKRLQIEHAPHLSEKAKLIKIADKLCNVRDVVHYPPAHWSLERRQEYLRWTHAVVAGCRGANMAMEAYYDQVLYEGEAALDEIARGDGDAS